MFVALADARARFPIPGEALHDLVDGGLQDLEQARYDDFDELRVLRAASPGAVGVACIAVYGAGEPQRAETLGIALQLINIIRDVARTGRSAVSTCRRTSSPRSASPRRTSPRAVLTPRGRR